MGTLWLRDFGIWNIPVWRKLVLLQKREEETLSIITESASKKEKQYLIIHTGRCCETSMRCVLCNHCWWPCCQAFQKHVLWSPDFVCMSWLGELVFKLGWLGLLRSGRGCKFSWVVVACAETFPHNHNWVPPFCNFRYVLKQKVVWVVYSDFFVLGLVQWHACQQAVLSKRGNKLGLQCLHRPGNVFLPL